MVNRRGPLACAALLVLVAACNGATDNTTDSPGNGDAGTATGTTSSSSSSGAATSSSSSSGSAASIPSGPSCQTGDTTATTTTAPSGCEVLTRDTSSCEDERLAAGITGIWLQVSCRVPLSVQNGSVVAETDDQPDYLSNYFTSSDPCHEAYTGGIQNPNLITAQSMTLSFPLAPSGAATTMHGAVVGMALNGVVIFGDFAAPGDDIYQEAMTFDRCGGHPQNSGVYHYHGEPYSLTYDDDRLVGFLLDGSPVYGRRDADGSVPTTLDATGGHTGTTPDSPTTPVYHYHVSLQTSTGARTAGEQQWFMTTGTWHGTPGTCSGSGCN